MTSTFMFVLDLNMKHIPFFLSFYKEVQEALVYSQGSSPNNYTDCIALMSNRYCPGVSE